MAIDTLSGGAFQDPAGNLIANGSITFQLSAPALVSGTGQVVPNGTISYALDGNGNIVAGAKLYGNDQLIPSGTFYIVNIFSAGGAPVRGPENWSLSGVSPISLTGITPATPSISYSGAVLLTPSGTQTITVGGLNPSPGASQSLGSLSSPWNASLATANINVANVQNGLAVLGLTTVANLNVGGYLNVTGTANLQNTNVTTLYATVANIGNEGLSGGITLYKGVATQGAGVPFIVAQNLSPNLQTNFNGGNPKTMYTTVAAGMYKLLATFTVINTPVAGNGPNLVLNYVDVGAVPRTVAIWSVMGTVSSNANVQANTYPMYCAAATNINVTSQGYTPGSGGALAYALGLTVEQL